MKTIHEFLSDLRSLDVKVWSEGDRLRYKAPKETLSPDLLQELRQRKAEILSFLHDAAAITNNNFSPILPVSRSGNLPLSSAQARLWFLNQMEPNSPVYNMPAAYRLTGKLNVTALKQSLCEIVRRHEVFRTVFPSQDGVANQIIFNDVNLNIHIKDLSEFSQEDREAETHRLAIEQSQQPFDLAQEQLLRVQLLILSPDEHVLLLNMHHIVYDGWSENIFFQELIALYSAFCVGKPSPLPELAIQYADFAVWQREWLQGEALKSQLEYWKQQLSGNLPVLQLPTDHQRPPVQTYEGTYQSLQLSPNLVSALKFLCQQSGVTLFMILLTAFKTLLYRYSGQEDIIVGTPIAGRNQVEIEGLIGLFVNSLALRTNLQGNPTFRELLNQVREVTLGAYSHQDLPLEKLIEELQLERDTSHSPLFQVMFVFQNTPKPNLELPGVTINPIEIHSGTAKFDLTLMLEETSTGIRGAIEYNTNLFEAATITRMLGHFQTLLEGIVTNPEKRLKDLPLLTPSEQHQLLFEFNQTKTNYPRDLCIHQLFEMQVERSPHAVALVEQNRQLTYQELNSRANQLAAYLRSQGVGSEVLVGICLERSIEAIVGILAILKAGGAYVPLDPAYPQERLAFMLDDTKVSVLLTQKQFLEILPATPAKIVDLDAFDAYSDDFVNVSNNVTANSLAYVMYTSGSTGRPKGVSVIHRSVVRLVLGNHYASFSSQEVFLQLAPISFDASTFEIWGSLLNGAKLAIFPKGTPSLEELGKVIRRQGVTTLWLTAGLFHLMVDERLEDLQSLRQLLAGGDALSVPHVEKFLATVKNCQLINGYGPTENTTFTCCYPMSAATVVENSVPIGGAIANTQVYILDERMQPVPIGIPGELYTGGDGLAREYLNCPDLTAEKFVTNPFSDEPDARLYKTGDLVRYRWDGKIEFLGRIDNQVKIRGFRIELGEIEAVLTQHPSVQQTVITVREDNPGDKRLVAYVVLHLQQTVTTDELHRFLKEKLPEYMVPSSLVILDSLPLTPNGKVDRRALPKPDQGRQESEKIFVAPRNKLEHQLTKIWENVLGIQPISITDRFFDLGGHSLLAVKLFAQIEKTFQKNLPLATLFASPTIEQLAVVLRSQIEDSPWYSLVPIQPNGFKKPFFLVPGGGGGQYELKVYAQLLYLLGDERPIYGFQARGWDGIQAPHTTVEAMAADYIKEIRSVQPEGPYLIGGECIGGVVAWEIAQQLVAQGQKVNLVLMDTAPPNNKRELRHRIEQFFQVKRIGYHLEQLKSISPSQRITYILNLPTKAKVKRQANDPTRYSKKVEQSYMNALMRYRLLPYPGRMTWLMTETVDRQAFIQQWKKLATGGLEIHRIPGKHKSYLGKDVQTTAQMLKTCLDAAPAES
ncbi:amino acid adenylation domain-containing protein [Nostoc sp. CENA67]|uniref:Amino acid adenylation domain-containing protein n=2 Tax=Amazonocrinis TaxID=2840440 RepID=A0A8J7HUF6_9NOST|nr:amino acid adenylation domain-containing protein [Amazonocrinis nigriterrae CENA67]